MPKSRYLTKSRFKLALECSAKLYYTGKKSLYPDAKLNAPFLGALAEGGFQVGELAKCYYPGGVDIKTLEYEESLNQTNALLVNENAVIFEAAVRYDNFFIRVDVLQKTGRNLELIEVKAKSVDLSQPLPFLTKKDTLSSGWRSYLYDVAFQKFVVQSAFPGLTVNAYLMLVDKSTHSPIDGLNQKFRIVKDGSDKKFVQVSPDLDESLLNEKILSKINVDEICELIFRGADSKEKPGQSFIERAYEFSDFYERDEKLLPTNKISSICSNCEFRATPDEEASGLHSGFKECWRQALGWSESDFSEPSVLDIWDFRRKDQLIEQGKLKMADLGIDDINVKINDEPGLSNSERQWLQVEKVKCQDNTPWIDVEGLRDEMAQWTYPLHFIDFETTMVALPFNKGRRPYEAIAFQFSHHVAYEDGRIEHKGEYLNTEIGSFPNYEFIRQLKSQLDQDQGTIFRYSYHENTFLNKIHEQLVEARAELPDCDDLLNFIRSISHSGRNSEVEWTGDRDMVDLCQLAKRYYYAPSTNGSNSIKQVLPALIGHSKILQEKYSYPIYGAKDGIPSCNFENWIWIKSEDGKLLDPYVLLPKLFTDLSERDQKLLLSSDSEIREGGAAMTAYARLQFEEMSELERGEITSALLKYCELDTLAMVMIYEGWRELTK